MAIPERRAAAEPGGGRGAVLPTWMGYLLAVLLPLLVTVTIWRVDDPGYRLGTAFVAAVALLTMVAGSRPAVVASGMGFVGFWYVVTPEPNHFAMHWPEGPVSLATYAGCCAVIVAVGHQRNQNARRYAASQRRARAEAEAARRRLEVVAEASSRLMSRLDPQEVIDQLVGVLVPELADVVAVFVPEGDLLRRARVVVAGRPDLGEVLSTRFPVPTGSDSPVAEAFRTGRTVEVSPDESRARARRGRYGEYDSAVEAMTIAGSVALPLRVGPDVLGVVALSGTESRGPLEPEAVLAARGIADRAALALQKAQSFTEERRIATLMQRALLPDSRRTIEGHEVGTCYVPAAVGREVGGDWWDVLPLPDGRVGLVVGDVGGHGVHVAPSMAKLRHSIDGVLTHGARPVDAATAASRLLETSRPGSYATAFVSVYDPATHELVYSRAGHPPPVVLVDGEVVHLDHAGGTLLGINELERAQTSVSLPTRFELVAFTDGLVEEPGLDYDDGVERLVRAVRRLPDDLTGQQRAEQLVADVVGTCGRDDVCVVMVRPCPPGAPPVAEADRP